MGQQSLIYSFVARGTVVLAEYTEFSGNFTSIASQCLQKLPASNNRYTIQLYGSMDDLRLTVWLQLSLLGVRFQLPSSSESRMILPRDMAEEKLQQQLLVQLKEQMQYCVDHPEEISKLSKVKAQVSEVKGVMMENIEKVLDRGEKIELLVDKTENLRSQAQDFRQQGTKMRRKMWLQNMKIKLIVLGILIALIFIIILSVCGGFNCGK
ncbi:hypothetical protein CJ030_MR0G006658 [Morella rubra]|uniref:V-SNARE coiled-coil homology domain-containing protein n=1 Tax=Morella rubra TaxID=262757 RepID=A0A6A1UKI3_9ROSI|nr:hypothetical protein CJ030_MR0G006658 [Morella rubra]